MIHNTILQLALKLPGGNEIIQPQELTDKGFVNLASFISPILNIIFYVSVFLAFYWLIWGAFQYMLSSGKKEELAKARLRITWAIIGLIIVFLAYFIARFGAEIFTPPQKGVPF